MVWSAFLAVTLSGEISPLMVLLCGPAVAASWFWEPPAVNVDRWSTAWTGLSVLFFIYTILAAITTGQFILAASGFILFLLVIKLFLRRSCRDYLHIYVLAFLLLVVGTVLNSELTYGIFFLGFVISSTWALTLFHLRREMEDNFLLKHSDDESFERIQVARILNSKRIVGRQFFLGTSAISLTIFISASLLFLTIPRIGFGLFFNKSRTGVTLAGFSDGVKLGGHGVIKSDDTVVMRVKIDGPYQGRRAPSIHWRGVAFDHYQNGQWTRSRRAPVTNESVRFTGSITRHLLNYDLSKNQRSRAVPSLKERLKQTTRQEVYLEPLGNDVLFAASMPQIFEFDRQWKNQPHRSRNDEIRHPHTAGIKYVVYSSLEAPSDEQLKNATGPLPRGYQAYLQIPDEITERVVALATEITGAQSSTIGKARALESWLKNKLAYTLVLESPGAAEPIDYFLFDRQRGHCEYFSSAMTIMLRSQGIAARNVNGFLGGEWNEYDNYIAIRAGDAHSWVEAYFPGHGWVTFDPTPSANIDQLGRGSLSWWAKAKRIADSLRFKWFKWVIEYDLGRQISLFRKLGRSIKASTRKLFSLGEGGVKNWFARNKRVLIGIGLSIALLLSLIGWLRQRDRPTAPRANLRRRKRSAVLRAYLSAEKCYRKLGKPRAPAITPRAHAATLVDNNVAGAKHFVRLTEIYYQEAWGRSRDDKQIAEANAQLAAIFAAITAAKNSA